MLCTCGEGEHRYQVQEQTSEGEKVQASQCLGQAFVITCETPKSRGPGKRAFEHPTPGQEREASFGLLILDHHEFHAVFRSGPGGFLAAIVLVDKGQFHAFTSRFLRLGGKLS